MVLDSALVGRDASSVADEGISHLARLVGASVRVTLDIEAQNAGRSIGAGCAHRDKEWADAEVQQPWVRQALTPQRGRPNAMPLPLKDLQAARALAAAFYDLLPGAGNKAWRGHVTFATVASRVGVGEFGLGGSKRPAIQTLLELTLERRRSLFERLVVEIGRVGIVYSLEQGRPLVANELDCINGHILELGLRFPELCDGRLRESLARTDEDRAKAAVERARSDEEIRRSTKTVHTELQTLRLELERLAILTDRSAAGRQLEAL